MVRSLLFTVLVALAATAASAAALPRSFTVTSFDRIRVEGPYGVTLSTGRAPFARAEGSAAALDAIDLRVEGRTLIIRQRGEMVRPGGTIPVRISVGTPDLRSASLIGAGSLSIDRLRGLSVDVAVAGPGSLRVGDVTADRVSAGVQGSGTLFLAGKVKSAALVSRGTAVLNAASLAADEVTIAAEGAGELSAEARSRATVAAAGTVMVRLTGAPACVQRVSGSAEVSGCRPGGR